LEQSSARFFEKFAYTCERDFDAQSGNFNTEFSSLLKELEPETAQIRVQWDSPDVILETKKILLDCQALLFQIHGALENRTLHLRQQPQERIKAMAGLLRNPKFDTNKVFESAFVLFNHTYRGIRGKIFLIKLPNLKNATKENTPSWITGCVLVKVERERFFQSDQPHYELRSIYNQTQERLGDLLKILLPQKTAFRAKDEQIFPGDYHNPTNLFRIGYQPAQPPAESRPKPTDGSSPQTVKNSNLEAAATTLPKENIL
jgi:hypothetical protein